MINLNKKQLLILILIGGVIIFVIGYYIYSITNQNNYEQIEEISENMLIETDENVEKEELEEIVVHISGQIKNEGIVRIKEGARIADIIDKAGGLTDSADLTNINLAYIVEDGQKITIPSKTDNESEKEYITTENSEGIIQETPETSNVKQQLTKEETNNKTTLAQKININKATSEELQTLPGIGESTASKIIEYRKQNGNFSKIEDLKNVSGIGDAKYDGVKDSIKVK